MKLDTRTLKPGDRVRIVIEAEVRAVGSAAFCSRNNQFAHKSPDIVSVELITPPLAVGDWVKPSSSTGAGKITAIGELRALVSVDGFETAWYLDALTRIDPPEGAE